MSKDIPTFTGTNYGQYRRLASMWASITTVKEEFQAITLIMNMKGKPLDLALTIDEELLKTTEAEKANNPHVGVKLLLLKMDEIYLKNDDATSKLEEMETLRRKPDQGMSELISIFESLSRALVKEGTVIPDSSLAKKMMKAANLSESDEKLARATCPTLCTEEMKKSLMRLADTTIAKNSGETKLPVIKTEPCFIQTSTEHQHQAPTESYAYQQQYYPTQEEIMFNRNTRGFGQRGRYQRPNFEQRNSAYQNGQCYGCYSPHHMIKDCPLISRPQGEMNPRFNPYRPPQQQNFRPNYQNFRSNYQGQGSYPQRHQRPQNPNGNHFSQRQPNHTYYQEQIPEYLSSMMPSQVNDYFYDYQDPQHPNYIYEEGQQPDSNQEKPIFFQSDVGQEEEQILFVGETVNKAVLDSGASKTVAGEVWYSCYLESLDDAVRATVKELPSDLMFSGIGAGKLEALKKVIIPARIGTRDMLLEVHIVNQDIPLLLSLQSMKGMGMILNTNTDMATMNGIDHQLQFTTNGHYTIPIKEEKAAHIFLVTTDDEKKAEKLHKRFAHAHSTKIIKLLKSAGAESKQLEAKLQDLDKTCEFCLKYKRVNPRPKVSLPMAETFNELVAVDLKLIGDTWVLHAIDYMSRFSSAATLKNKSTEEVIGKFFTIWIAVFGPPKRILSDNGGEFISYAFESMCESFNITQLTTAAEAPFSNGVCERHNGLIGDMTAKVFQDIKCPMPIALMWAVHAKNSLINISGFSPYQLVFGTNPNVPGVTSSNLPALEGKSPSETVATHLNSLHRAREACMKAESSDRLRRALLGRVYEGTHQRFFPGDKVYFKREKHKEWHGPATVVAQDGTNVLVKSGGFLVRVHPCKMVLKSEADSPTDRQQRSEDQQDVDLENECTPTIAIEEEGVTQSQEEEEVTVTVTSNEDQPREGLQTCMETNEKAKEVTEGSPQNEANSEAMINTVIDEAESNDVTDNEATNDKSVKKSTQKKAKIKDVLITEVKKGDKIIYQVPDSEEWNTVTLTTRGYRATSANKNYWNALTSDQTPIGVNLDKVDWLKDDATHPSLEQTSGTDASIAFASAIDKEIFVLNTETCKSANFQQSKETEIETWRKFDVFTEVDRRDFANHDVISCKWVESEKSGHDQSTIYKSRLCVRGFEEKDPPKGDSPTAGKNILRMFLALAGAHGWKVEMMDVRAAFLQSDKLTRTVLVKPPKEFRRDSHTVWKLNKPVYGLIDAARCWYKTVKRVLEGLGCTALKLDKSIYIYHHNNKFAGFLIIHVDDFLVGGDETFKTAVINQLVRKFQIRCREQDEFKYIGWSISQDQSGIHIDQNSYKDTIVPITMSTSRQNQTDHQLNDVETKQYQKLLGQLQWITSQSRPDMRFKVLECSIKANKPTVAEVLNINRVVKKLKKLNYCLFLPNLSGDVSKYTIMVFCDAALNNLPDNIGSTQAYVIFLECEGNVVPLSWSSKKITRVCKLIIYAECMALSVSVDHALILRETLIETVYCDKKGDLTIPINVFTDCYSLYQNIHSDNQADDLKVRREVASIKEKIDLEEINSVKWVPNESQLADSLTKTTGSATKLIEVLQTGSLKTADIYG